MRHNFIPGKVYGIQEHPNATYQDLYNMSFKLPPLSGEIQGLVLYNDDLNQNTQKAIEAAKTGQIKKDIRHFYAAIDSGIETVKLLLDANYECNKDVLEHAINRLGMRFHITVLDFSVSLIQESKLMILSKKVNSYTIN